MDLDIGSIRDERVRVFYSLYWPQHQIVKDFFASLGEAHYDYRMVDRPERKSSTPRQSLAHILNVQWMYLNGARNGKMTFVSGPIDQWKGMSKKQLLENLDALDQELYEYLTSETFDSNRTTEVPWGAPMNAVDVVFFLRDHDILHIGWNLAYMDHLGIARYESLKRYWGP